MADLTGFSMTHVYRAARVDAGADLLWILGNLSGLRIGRPFRIGWSGRKTISTFTLRVLRGDSSNRPDRF